MPRLIVAALALIFGLASQPAAAEVDCAPNCDFTHYYGPYDYTWVRPGLYRYAYCGASGNCSPYVISSSRFRGRVTVRLVRPRPRP